jgi:integrase
VPPIRIHALRHTGATYAIADGVTTAVQMQRMGQTDPRAFHRYLHPNTDMHKAAVDLIRAERERRKRQREVESTSPITSLNASPKGDLG